MRLDCSPHPHRRKAAVLLVDPSRKPEKSDVLSQEPPLGNLSPAPPMKVRTLPILSSIRKNSSNRHPGNGSRRSVARSPLLRFQAYSRIRPHLSAQGSSWCPARQGHSLCSKHSHGVARSDSFLLIISGPGRHHHLPGRPYLLVDRVSWSRKVIHRTLLGQHARRSRRRFVFLLVILEGHQ